MHFDQIIIDKSRKHKVRWNYKSLTTSILACRRPPISYKPEPKIEDTHSYKAEYLKVDIKNQPGERDRKTVAIHMTVFMPGSPESLLKFVAILNKIIKGKDLSTQPQRYGMTRNPFMRYSLQVFEHKTWDWGTETNSNYELVMKDIITHFFPPKFLQH